MPIVTLTTDFGHQDYYVAAMKGIILQIAPRTTIVDVTHQVVPHDITQTAFVIRQLWPCFPRGTIHLAVVDPGVGTSRRILAAQYNGQVIICPDNGIVSLVHRDATLELLRDVTNVALFARQVSHTFQGRDIMAPAAAHLARGGKLTDLGPGSDRLELLSLPRGERLPDLSLRGQVIYVDGFGNLITNLTNSELTHTLNALPHARVWLGDREIGPIRQAYAHVEPGQGIALIGSAELLEIAVNRGRASEQFNARAGAPVFVR
jgi:S-adenosyl-L-methionine hydrolase (adenosine-forming)